jgi:hypothetical protein
VGAIAQVKLGEELGAMELVQKLINNQDRKLVLRRLIIEGAVVDAEVLVAIHLLNQQDRH